MTAADRLRRALIAVDRAERSAACHGIPWATFGALRVALRAAAQEGRA